MVGGMSAAGVEKVATQLKLLPWCERLTLCHEMKVSMKV